MKSVKHKANFKTNLLFVAGLLVKHHSFAKSALRQGYTAPVLTFSHESRFNNCVALF